MSNDCSGGVKTPLTPSFGKECLRFKVTADSEWETGTRATVAADNDAGFEVVFEDSNGSILAEAPAQTAPCPDCGTDAQPVYVCNARDIAGGSSEQSDIPLNDIRCYSSGASEFTESGFASFTGAPTEGWVGDVEGVQVSIYAGFEGTTITQSGENLVTTWTDPTLDGLYEQYSVEFSSAVDFPALIVSGAVNGRVITYAHADFDTNTAPDAALSTGLTVNADGSAVNSDDGQGILVLNETGVTSLDIYVEVPANTEPDTFIFHGIQLGERTSGVSKAVPIRQPNGTIIWVDAVTREVLTSEQESTFFDCPLAEAGDDRLLIETQQETTAAVAANTDTLQQLASDPTGKACDTPTFVSLCDRDKQILDGFCYATGIATELTPLQSLNGELPDGTTYAITSNGGTITQSPSGGIQWGVSTVLTIEFSAPVQLEVSMVTDATNMGGSVQTWQGTTVSNTELVTNGDPMTYVAGPVEANINISADGLTARSEATGAPAVRSVTDDWGTLLVPNTTRVQVTAVDTDQMQFAARARELGGQAYKVFDAEGVFEEYRDRVTDVVIDSSLVAPCPEATGLTHSNLRTAGVQTILAPYRSIAVVALSGDVEVDGQALPQGVPVSYGGGSGEAFSDNTTVSGTDYWLTVVR